MTSRDGGRRLAPAERRKIAKAATLWGGLVLTGTSLIAGLTIWHLIRRGRLLRDALDPPKPNTPLEVPPGQTA